jgi:hypothetical protein
VSLTVGTLQRWYPHVGAETLDDFFLGSRVSFFEMGTLGLTCIGNGGFLVIFLLKTLSEICSSFLHGEKLLKAGWEPQ